MYSIKTYLKGQGYLKVKVKFTQYQGQVKGNQFSSVSWDAQIGFEIQIPAQK